MFKQFKILLKPNTKTNDIHKQAGACRFVWNHFLNRNIEQYQINKTFVWFNDMCKELTQLKKQTEYNWLKEVHSIPLQQRLMDLDKALKRMKIGFGFPKFKSRKYQSDTFRHNQGFHLNNKTIKIPKIGYIKWKPHRKLEGKAKSITIKQEQDKWYCSVLCEIPDIDTKQEFNTSVGIDLGLKTFAVLSNGTQLDTPKFYRKAQNKLAQRQRHLSKKTKGSINRNKARKQVAKLHLRIRNQRTNQLHNWSKAITKHFDVVCMEDLNISGMIKNHCLAKAIADQGWNQFVQQIDYKSKLNGGLLIQIDRWYPSTKTCNCCGAKQNMTLDKRTYVCGSCGMEMDRDINAAINIEKIGLSTGSIVKVPKKTNIDLTGDQATRMDAIKAYPFGPLGRGC